MSRKASNFQKAVMSWGYRGKEIFKPLNTGRIDDNVACVREWIANIFFYTRDWLPAIVSTGRKMNRRLENWHMSSSNTWWKDSTPFRKACRRKYTVTASAEWKSFVQYREFSGSWKQGRKSSHAIHEIPRKGASIPLPVLPDKGWKLWKVNIRALYQWTGLSWP